MLRTVDAVQAAPDADAATLLSMAGDVLAEHLDTMQGDSVNDPSIFRSHAARYVESGCIASGCTASGVLVVGTLIMRYAGLRRSFWRTCRHWDAGPQTC